MNPPLRETRCGISRWIKSLISAVVLWHFAGLFFAAVAPPIPGFAPSALVSGIYDRLFRTPLEFLGLTNPHRYYAPGIGPFTQAWFRATLADRTVRWMELPGPRNPFLPARCQRRFGIAMALQTCTAARPDDPGAQVLTPPGCLLAASYARHVAVELGRADGPVVEVQVYQVVHRIRLPDEVQHGWLATDLRLYAPRYLGTYSADGRSPATDDPAPRRAPVIPMSLFAATILREDVWPANGTLGDAKILHLPTPIELLLKSDPTFAKPQDEADLRQRIVQSVESQDSPTPFRSAGEW